MARGPTRRAKKRPTPLGMLDALIRRSFIELLDSIGENAKIGDFIKMLETRHKLTPAGDDQGAFWAMLQKIREDALAEDREDGTSEVPGEPQSDGREKSV